MKSKSKQEEKKPVLKFKMLFPLEGGRTVGLTEDGSLYFLFIMDSYTIHTRLMEVIPTE